jgi:hypothetical protein
LKEAIKIMWSDRFEGLGGLMVLADLASQQSRFFIQMKEPAPVPQMN